MTTSAKPGGCSRSRACGTGDGCEDDKGSGRWCRDGTVPHHERASLRRRHIERQLKSQRPNGRDANGDEPVTARPIRDRLLFVGLALVFGLSFLVFAVLSTAQATVLDEHWYQDALAHTHAYDRVYNRVLPERRPGNASNFVAVDSSTIGGLTDAVHELNGVRSAR